METETDKLRPHGLKMIVSTHNTIAVLARIVKKIDKAIHRINHYPTDRMVLFVSIYPFDCDLPGGERYPTLEQPGTRLYVKENLGQKAQFFPQP